MPTHSVMTRFFASLRMTRARWSPLNSLAPKAGVLLAAEAVSLLLTACNSNAASTAAPQEATSAIAAQTVTPSDPGPIMTVSAEGLRYVLGQFLSAQTIAIQDYWTGLSAVPNRNAYYYLIKSADGYQGLEVYSTGGSVSAGGSGSTETITATVSIPLRVAQDFLKQLATVPLEAGEYQPKIDHTDDYPSKSIEIQLSNQLVHFYSQSQGTDNVPWGADISGMKYTINSGQPAQALTMLAPYLKH